MNRSPAPLPVLAARAAGLTGCPAWPALQAAALTAGTTSLRDMLDRPGRYTACSRSAAGLHLDFSRQRLDDATLGLLLQLAAERDLGDWIAQLFAGGDVNSTEHRPALHMALRSSSTQPLPVQGHRLAVQLPPQRGGRRQSQPQRQPRRGITTAEKLVYSKSHGLSSTETNRAKSKLFHAAR